MCNCQPQVVDTVTTITSQLVLVSTGVFAIVGGIVAARSHTLHWVPILITSLFLFALSALSGYLLQGRVVNELQNGSFDPGGVIRYWGLVQISSFLTASCMFISFIAKNLHAQGIRRSGGSRER